MMKNKIIVPYMQIFYSGYNAFKLRSFFNFEENLSLKIIFIFYSIILLSLCKNVISQKNPHYQISKIRRKGLPSHQALRLLHPCHPCRTRTRASPCSVNVPIHLSSTYAQKDIAQPYTEHEYTRCSNPTRTALEKCIAAIEYGKHCITFSSGLGGLAAVFHTVSKGDHVIVSEQVYGGTRFYLHTYMEEHYGVQVDFIDMTNLTNLKNAIKHNTKFVWIQTPSNPTLKIIDINEAVKVTRAINPKIKIVVDNTFCSPYLQSPLLLGADIVFNSCSKYIGGHSDLIGGSIVYNDDEFHKEVYLAAISIGTNPSVFDCYLMLRALKTLEVRVIKATSNAYHLAHFLQQHPAVKEVYYPGLKSFPFHQVAKKQMRGYGGMVSFRIRGEKQNSSKFARALKVFILAVSLGGPDSLVELPILMTQRNSNVPLQTRIKLGITEDLIRLSVGIESIEDIIADVDQALKFSQE